MKNKRGYQKLLAFIKNKEAIKSSCIYTIKISLIFSMLNRKSSKLSHKFICTSIVFGYGFI